MSGSGKAVFISYASQDAGAAKRICEALRAADVEVWFDQSELRGGDAWDQKIRRQIKDCALFMPVISAATQARREGYFRLEWKLAEDRTHLMAHGTPFLVPVCVDGTRDDEAMVPDSFLRVQWTRLAESGELRTESLTPFCARVRELLDGSNAGPVPSPRGTPRIVEPERRAASPLDRLGAGGGPTPWLIAAIAVVAVGYLGFRAWRNAGIAVQNAIQPPAAAVATAPKSEATQLAERARATYEKIGHTHEELATAEDLARTATERDNGSALAWGIRARTSATYLNRTWDITLKRRQDTQQYANTALGLEPENADALYALGQVLYRQSAYEQSEASYRRALKARPADSQIADALSLVLSVMGRSEESRQVLEEALRRDPGNSITLYVLAQHYAHLDFEKEPRALEQSLQTIETGLQARPFASLYVLKATLLGGWRADLAGMRAALDELAKMPLADRLEDRAVYVTMWSALLSKDPARAVTAGQITAKDYFEDSSVPARPKDWLIALAHRQQGLANLAKQDWERAEAVIRSRKGRPGVAGQLNSTELATTLAWLGRTEEAAREIAPVEAAARESPSGGAYTRLALYYAGLGNAAKTVEFLKGNLTFSPYLTAKTLRLDPWLDKLRGQPEFEAFVASTE